MQNCKTSVGTTAQKSLKSRLLFRPATLAAILMLAAVFCQSCNTDKKKETITTPLEMGKYATIIIDSCEYLQYYVDLKYGNAYTTTDYQTKLIAHKGNCKFCAARK
jgi:hypothetical protein